MHLFDQKNALKGVGVASRYNKAKIIMIKRTKNVAFVIETSYKKRRNSKYIYIALDEAFDKELIKQMFKFIDA